MKVGFKKLFPEFLKNKYRKKEHKEIKAKFQS
jgi:hypothetical protein